MKRIFLSIVVLSGFWSAPASAGTFADGYGETLPEAIKSALEVAEAAIRTKGKGCVMPYKGETIRIIGKSEVSGTTIWHVTAHYANQAGSCGQKSTDEIWIRNTAANLVSGMAK